MDGGFGQNVHEKGDHKTPKPVPEMLHTRVVLHSLVPLVRVTRVLPGLRTLNTDGALMSYHSLRVKGSTLSGEHWQYMALT